MLERYAFGFLILFLFSFKLIKALIKVSDTKSSACSKLFVFLRQGKINILNILISAFLS